MACAASGMRSASHVDQHDRGDHSGHPRLMRRRSGPTVRRPRSPGFRLAQRRAPKSIADTGIELRAGERRGGCTRAVSRRPRSPGATAQRALRAGSAHGGSARHEPGAAAVEPAQQEPDLLGGRAAQRTRPGQHDLRARAERVDHRHRRHPARGDPGRGEPSVADDRDLPAAAPVGARADQLVDGGERGQPLAAAQRQHQPGEPVAMAGRGLEPFAGGVGVDACAGAAAGSSSSRPPKRSRDGDDRRRVFGGGLRPAHGAPQRPSSASAQGLARAPAQGCVACRNAPAPHRGRVRRPRPPPARRAGTGPPPRPAAWPPPTAAGTPRAVERDPPRVGGARERRL